MPLEEAEHISELIDTNPTGGDNPTFGDDHLNLIKKVLKNDLGGISTPVYEDADVNGAGGSTLATGVTMSSWEARIKASEDAIAGTSGFIVGMIIDWSGTVATIPANWALCDGLNGTPDLRNKFIVAAGDTYTPGDEGGSNSAVTEEDGLHPHDLTIAAHMLTEAEIPNHDHSMFTSGQVSSSTTPVSGDNPVARYTTGGLDQAYVMEPGSGTPSDGSTGNTGGAGFHGHVGSTAISNGAHSHTITDARPLYYALAKIMYVGTP